jgi:tetratricopeptide (TPR) repeat protein
VQPSPEKSGEGFSSMRQSIWNYLLTVVVSAAMGAAVTWLIMSQRSTSDVRAMSAAQPNQLLNAAPDVSRMSAGEAAVTLGNFAYDHQQWPDAIRHYQQAIASGVDNADVHTDLGNSFRFSGQPQQALTQYEIAQRLNPQHENSLFNQISLFIETLNQPSRAIPICEEFIRRFPNSEKLPAVREQLEREKGMHR